ncbi:hypothetical protein DTO013E5_9803 [Penicillium roqueforti]|nr:hypothetical protein CBS147354_9755 [Penicillium roqueforti]KAI2736136.1 hypothetical protein DTO012A1_8580 [Penicillium roqueforti]KAI2738961.1 hypothetical protein DTO013F2_9467 [Penicillium roqueforti]KAI2768127.1 hypothetical protein DTO012A8_6646 [Penicillium roqueforti]KAI3063511.1 hypothetical protein CBS147339_9649 [Penicillium roqueforti]
MILPLHTVDPGNHKFSAVTTVLILDKEIYTLWRVGEAKGFGASAIILVRMSDIEIIRQITDLIGVTESIMVAFGSIKDLSSLPEAFQEAMRWLPLVENTLRHAKRAAEKLNSTEDARALKTVLHDCDKKADNILEIFEQLGEKSNGEYNSSVYRCIVIKQGKQRVETLMDGILEDLGTLVTHKAFLGEMHNQINLLAKAREYLAGICPSLADSDLADQPRAANQYGENSRQYNLFGEGTQRIADGHYFEAKGNQNFGIFPSKESVETR